MQPLYMRLILLAHPLHVKHMNWVTLPITLSADWSMRSVAQEKRSPD